MDLSNLFKAIFLILPTSFALSSCNLPGSDPYGLIEAEEFGGQPERLVKCSQNEECPEYAQALFWIAIDMLSKAESKIVKIGRKDFELTRELSIEERLDRIEQLLFSPPYSGTSQYDFNSSEFKTAFVILEKSYQAGSVYASNELGLLCMEQNAVKDLDMAEMYFQDAFDKGDLLSAYNLARIVRMRSPNDNKRILKFLEIAAQGKNKDMDIMYMLGLEFFGAEYEKQDAINYFKKNEKAKFNLSYEFKNHFGINEPE